MGKIKTIHFADLHISPTKWPEYSKKILRFIYEQVKFHMPDYLFSWGDFFNEGNNDDVNLIWIREWVESVSRMTNFMGVSGTPAHDNPGCYHSWGPIGYTDLKLGIPYVDEKIIVFGIPELNKRKLNENIGIRESNEKFNYLLSQVIRDKMAPLRTKHDHLPCIVGLHGDVIDSEATPHFKISSGRMIRTGDLEEINADFYCGGHIHMPWKSEKISFEYCGSTGHDSRPWSNRGFTPRMILVELGNKKKIINYIPYPVPRKEKIKLNKDGWNGIELPKPESKIDLWVEYHAESKDDKIPDEVSEFLNKRGYNKLKVTIKYPEKIPVIKNVSQGDILSYANSINPNLTDKQKEIILNLNKKNSNNRMHKKIFFSGSSYKGLALLKESEGQFIPPHKGIVRIKGPTGSGKSTLTGMMYPLPGIIKTPISGKKSAYHSFFDGENSFLIKVFVVEKEIVTIKAAIDSIRKKIEYYITANNVINKTTSYKEAENILIDIFGTHEILLSSVFQIQPGTVPGVNNNLSLCTKSDLRDLFFNLLGISRDSELKECNKNIKKASESLSLKQNELKIRERDIEELQKKKSEIIESLSRYEDIEETLYRNQKMKEEKEKIENDLLNVQKAGTESKKILNDISLYQKSACEKCGYIPQGKDMVLKNLVSQNPDIESKYYECRQKYSQLRSNLEKIKLLNTTEEDNLKKGINEIDVITKNIKAITEEIKILKLEISRIKCDLADYETIRPLFLGCGIPLIEMATNKQLIESVVNRKLNIFEEGRFEAEIKIDNFDIMIYDTKTEKEKSFSQFSPGEKSIIGVALQEGAIKAAEEFHGLWYGFRVVDEGDTGISPEYISQYYDILRDSVKEGKTVYVISHNLKDDSLFDEVIEIK